MSVWQSEGAIEREREQQKENENKQRAPFRSSPQTHHSVWQDDSSRWPQYSYRAFLGQSHMHHLYPHMAHKNTVPLMGQRRNQVFISQTAHSNTTGTYCKISAFPVATMCLEMQWISLLPRLERVYPLASHNIDKAVLSGSKLSVVVVTLADRQGVVCQCEVLTGR